MYSLYRAWLSLGPCPMPLPPPPVGPLTGAPDVSLQVGPQMTHFSAHRAVLAAHSGFFKSALLNFAEPTPISVPNVNVDEFSSLLTFMYTGYLDLNLSNIYNILLATHILHMPRALEICRSFLIQSHPAPLDSPPTLIKPIASRKAAAPLQPILAPSLSLNLNKSEDTPFRAVTNEKPAAAASTSKVPEPVREEPKPKKVRKKVVEGATHCTATNPDKIIVDIACCDGPVRFHRVINKLYGQQGGAQAPQAEHPYPVQEAMNKAMHENIRQMSDENGVGSTAQNAPSGSSELFTCLYCKHTFKSQYCYQKHARRHLNPVGLEAKGVATPIAKEKREVKLLDMNVQYYPCKTCGSKFPSYYFVHKHRKMCHAEEVDSGDKEATPPQDNSNSGSAIDVEAVNTDTDV